MGGMKNVLSKELTRVFKDKKMLFSIFILPLILILGMFYLMTNMMNNVVDDVNKHVPVVYIQNAPQEFKTLMNQIDENAGNIVYYEDEGKLSEIKDGILNESTDLCVVFPKNFAEMVTQQKVPDIKTFYNPSVDYSSEAKETYSVYLEQYRQSMLMAKFGTLDAITIFSVDANNSDMVIQDANKATGKMLGNLLPYFVTIMIFASAMSLGIDTIAGEKERGTMASLLLTPAKRSSIVMGKLFSLMILAVLSAAVYGISMIIAGSLLGSAFGDSASFTGLSINFTALQIFQLIVILLGLAFLYVALIAVVSVFAKNVKTASSYVMPLYIVVIVAGLLTMYGGSENSLVMYAIPLYNSTIALKSVLSGDITMIQFALTALSSLAAAGVITAIIAKVFDNEKVMFNA